MTENQSPWLSAKLPPKQSVSMKRQRLGKGPLSRKLLPLQMTAGYGSRLTQNSPPPVQLKLARKQSLLMDYFGSSGKNASAQDKIKESLDFDSVDESCKMTADYPRPPLVCDFSQHQQRTNIFVSDPCPKENCDQLQSQESVKMVPSRETTVSESLDENPSSDHTKCHYSDATLLDKKCYAGSRCNKSKSSPLREIQMPCEAKSSSHCLLMSTNNHGAHSKHSVSCCVKKSPTSQDLKMSVVPSERLSCETEERLVSCGAATHNYNDVRSATSSNSFRKYTLDLQSPCVREKQRDVLDLQASSVRENHRDEQDLQSPCFREKARVGETSRDTVFNEDDYCGRERWNSVKMCPPVTSTLESEPETYTSDFSNRMFETSGSIDANSSDQTETQESSFDAFGDGTESETKSSHSMGLERKRKKINDQREQFKLDNFSSDLFAMVRSDSDDEETPVGSRDRDENSELDFEQSEWTGVQDVDSRTLDFDSEITSDINFSDGASISLSTEIDLNVPTDTSLSFTQDSQSLQISQDIDWSESEAVRDSTPSILKQIYGNSRERLCKLKAQHISEMETLAFSQSQTQTFPL